MPSPADAWLAAPRVYDFRRKTSGAETGLAGTRSVRGWGGIRASDAPNQKNTPTTTHFGDDTMTTMTAGTLRPAGMTSEQRLVIFASSLGTVFEWYDFYIYGTLGVFLAKYFFSNVPANVGF